MVPLVQLVVSVVTNGVGYDQTSTTLYFLHFVCLNKPAHRALRIALASLVITRAMIKHRTVDVQHDRRHVFVKSLCRKR